MRDTWHHLSVKHLSEFTWSLLPQWLWDSKFITENLHYKLAVWNLKDMAVEQPERAWWNTLSNCIMGNVVFLAYQRLQVRIFWSFFISYWTLTSPTFFMELESLEEDGFNVTKTFFFCWWVQEQSVMYNRLFPFSALLYIVCLTLLSNTFYGTQIMFPGKSVILLWQHVSAL